MNKLVISASRRTDIPAYYADWFSTALKKGYTYYKNPYSGIPVFTDLSPGNVKAFVFWTRNPRPEKYKTLSKIRLPIGFLYSTNL